MSTADDVEVVLEAELFGVGEFGIGELVEMEITVLSSALRRRK